MIGSHVTHHYCAAGAVSEFFNGIQEICTKISPLKRLHFFGAAIWCRINP
jgi:hypothetical protein